METPIPPAAPAPPPPPMPPAPVPPPVPVAVPVPAPAEPAYNAGGFLKTFDWVEIGFMALAALAIYHIIAYNRKRAKEEPKLEQTISQMQTKIDQHDKNFDGIKKLFARRM